ncbi:MAG: K(+)-transporting ATPase subunit C [Bacteroidales bacterium]|nr:K(+)-transporting ATPase subunit C [Bacteroidales bacterium]
MKKNLLRSLKITIVFCIFLSVTYIGVLRVFAMIVTPNNGNAQIVELNGKIVGAANVGQNFTQDIYFWGRPSAVDYNGSGSGGSNKGPTNPEYLEEVEARITAFLEKHPYLSRAEVPAEMVTASGSGLDPHISPEAAYVQMKRVAQARGMSLEEISVIVDKQIEKPLLGLFGTPKVNVLKLNVALEEVKK